MGSVKPLEKYLPLIIRIELEHPVTKTVGRGEVVWKETKEITKKIWEAFEKAKLDLLEKLEK